MYVLRLNNMYCKDKHSSIKVPNKLNKNFR